MGIVIFFFHYARYMNNIIYENYAYDLLGEIYEDIDDDITFSFENGLCGIGWGILYLIENGFVKGEPNEILSDLDKRIMELNLMFITDLSIKTGLKGVLLYIKRRVENAEKNSLLIPYKKFFMKQFECLYIQYCENINFSLVEFVSGNNELDNDLQGKELGLCNGCAGYGLNKILSYEKVVSF